MNPDMAIKMINVTIQLAGGANETDFETEVIFGNMKSNPNKIGRTG
jgi:hypothetical protein